MRASMICEAESGVRADDEATALRGVAAFAAARLRNPGRADFVAIRLAVDFFVTLADLLDVLTAIVFTPGLR